MRGCLGLPLLDLRMLVGGVVVADQVKRLVARRLAVDLAQEDEPFDVAMTLLAARDDRTIERTHCSKQRGRAVALVVVGHGGSAPGLHRQTRLGAIQRLYLTLLIATQHQRMLGRGHVQTDDVFEFLDEVGVARHLEALDLVRLEPVRLPDALYGGVAHAHHRRQRASAPLRRPLRSGLRGQAHDFCRIDRGLASTSRQIHFDRLQPALDVTLAPATYLNPANPHQLGNLSIVQPIGCKKHDAGAPCQTHFRRIRMRQLHQLRPVRIVQFNLTCHSHRRPQRLFNNCWTRQTNVSSRNYEALH